MLPSKRQELILRRIESEGSVRSLDLASAFGVTNETIRKDLEALAGAKRIVRIHGGATGVSDSRHDLPLPARQSVSRFEKSVVAREAVRLIEPKDTIFMDASSTVLTMTDYLPAVPLTILTNAHHVIVALGGRPEYDLICTGGNYEERSRSYVGAMAEDALKRFMIKWLFVGVDGLHHEMGASEVNPGQAVLKERLIPRAENVCVVCDSSKLEKKSPFIFAPVRKLDFLVTDSRADPKVLRLFEGEGIRVRIAELPEEGRGLV
ncbi:DeoR/GlpR family DNA-binding transcription regulator [Coraliomargarita parva]|uniref:DeoR/GlpR family DNA-binding transcription regulator n=1 Tax=Coraliomargarita parva TaxID=3014050 RepID=UPI0022B4770F|nr:DeoR/GlpR family DNA-binding transcription regulator [Coraliomargarita parva]